MTEKKRPRVTVKSKDVGQGLRGAGSWLGKKAKECYRGPYYEHC